MRRHQWRRFGRAVVLLALWAGLVSAATVGAVRLDERYRATRFRTDGVRQCPLVAYANTATPMCQPTGPGW